MDTFVWFVTGLVALAMARLIWRERYELYYWLRTGSPPMSSVSSPPDPTVSPTSILRSPQTIMSRDQKRRIVIGSHRLLLKRQYQREKRRKREAEARSRSAEVRTERDIKERMDRALRTYAELPRIHEGRAKVVKISDSLVLDLMGINEQEFYRRLKQYREDHAERERLRALPHDPELERMVPLPH